MRGPFVAVAPVAAVMQQDLGFSAVELGLLTGLPVLCFSLAAPLASLVAHRLGAEVAVTLTLLGVLAGVIVRSAGGGSLVMLGTVIGGLAVTIGNTALPLIIRRDFSSRRQGTALGIYTAALNIGSFVTSLGTAPLAEVSGWRPALAVTALFAVAAIALWVAAFRRRAVLPGTDESPGRSPSSWPRLSRWITVGLTVGFAGQAIAYYGITAWLPSLLADELRMAPAAAGAGSSLFQIFAIIGALGVPRVARTVNTTMVVLILGALWLTVPVGLLLGPELWWLWSSLGGVAQGGGITIIFFAIIKLARDQVSAGRMSAIVQGVGYGVAALAPTVLGFMHSFTGDWEAPLLAILVSAFAFILGTALSVRTVSK